MTQLTRMTQMTRPGSSLMYTCHSFFQINVLSVEKIYAENLKMCNSYYKLDKRLAYVVSDLKTCGQLSRSYCLVQQKIFYSSCAPSQKLALLLCSCDGSQLHEE